MRATILSLALGVTFALAPSARADFVLPPPAHKLNQATSLIVIGRFHEAEPLLRESLTLDQSQPEAHYNLGVVLRETNRFDQAIAEFKTADQLFAPNDQPNRAKCLYGIALAAESQGDADRAMAAWQDYIRFDSRFAGSQPAVAIARQHLEMQQNIAQTQPRPPGTQKAGR